MMNRKKTKNTTQDLGPPKRLVYQVYTGKRSELYDFCVDSVMAYCEKYSIDHIVQKNPIMKIKPDVFATNRSTESYEKYGGFLPIYEKENAFDYFDLYDQIAIIDADVWIRPDSPDVFDYLSNAHDFGGVVEREMPILPWYQQKIKNYSHMQYHPLREEADFTPLSATGYEFFNMGVMVMNKSITKYLRKNGIQQSGKEFIERPEFKRFVDGLGAWKWSTDQTLLNYWVRKEKMNLCRLNWKWNALYTAVSNDDIKKANFVHFFLKDKLPNKGENVEELRKIVI